MLGALAAAATSGRCDRVRELLVAGADPDDGESLYHAAYVEDPACLRLLLEHGADPIGTNALAAALDLEHPEHVRLLLAHGADPDEGAALVHAVRRGRGLGVIVMLADAGADLERRGGEWNVPRAQHRTAYQQAVLRDRDDVVAELARRGASTAVAPEDRAVAALARGEPGTLPEPLAPDAQEVLVEAALAGRTDAVPTDRLLHAGGGPPGTLLHHAAWRGDATAVERLLARGADPVARSGAEWDTPLAWAAHGSAHGGDHVRVFALLTAAGAELEPRFAQVVAGPLAEWLQAR